MGDGWEPPEVQVQTMKRVHVGFGVRVTLSLCRVELG